MSMQARDSNGSVIQGVFRRFGGGQSVAYTGTHGAIANPMFTDCRASAVLTSDNTNVSDGDTVTIATAVYTFKTILTPTAGQVLIGADADASLLNLIRCINHTGTPGTDYANAGIGSVASTFVAADASVTAHAMTIRALLPGIVPNGYPTAEAAATLSWASGTMVGGSGPAPRLIRVMTTTAAFVVTGSAPVATAANGLALAANTPIIMGCMDSDKVSAVQVASGGTLYVTELY